MSGEGREREVHWRPPRNGVWMPLWRFAAWILGVIGPPLLGFRVSGRENLPERGGVLVVVNHPADIDPAVMGVACAPRPAQYVALAEHFRHLPLALLLFGLGGFPIRSGRGDVRAMRHAREQLRAGRVVVIFPEGGARWGAPLGEFQEGAGHIALTPGATVVPAALWGTQHVLRGWRPVGRGPIRVVFGPPVEVPAEGTTRERAAEVTRRARAAVAALLEPMAGPRA